MPYDEYVRLVEDAEMLADVRAFDSAHLAMALKEEELIPSEVVDRLLDGENPVRVWREHRGVSAAELAKSCGVSAAAISQIEAGKRRPSVVLLKKMASNLDVDIDDLLAEETSEAAPGSPTD